MTSQCFYSGAYFTAGSVSNTPRSHFNKACIYSEQCVMAHVIWVRQADSSSSTWFTEVFVLVLCICAISGMKLDFWEHKAILWYRSECDYVHPDWNDGLVSLITEKSFFFFLYIYILKWEFGLSAAQCDKMCLGKMIPNKSYTKTLNRSNNQSINAGIHTWSVN